MYNHLAMPTQHELVEMSYSELDQGSLLAYFLWQQKGQSKECKAEYWQIYKAYVTEQKKRLPQFQGNLK